MKIEVNVTTLEDVCKKLIEYKLYDFNEPLQVCYRMQEPDLQDGLFGYCHVIKKMSGFSIDSDDGDSYSMTDEIMLWSFMPPMQHGEKTTLCVWIPTEWTKGE